MNDYLDSVLTAQAGASAGFATALREIKAGRKQSHWIWYVWPVLKGVRPNTSRPEFDVPNLEYAQAWLSHPTLGPRLQEITSAAVTHLEAGAKPERLFGSSIDVFKFHNCLTLFRVAATQATPPNTEAASLFDRGLQALGHDAAEPTIALLSKAADRATHRAD